jgi:hypothetical protein
MFQWCERDTDTTAWLSFSARQSRPAMHLRDPSVPLRALPFCLDYIRTLDKIADNLSSENILRLKKAVADANYHIMAAEVANKLIDDTQAVTGRKRRYITIARCS